MVNGEKLHATQKPEALLYRVILSSSDPGDVILDPFFGTGTTGAVARKLGRRFIGIERDQRYIKGAQARIDAVPQPQTVNDAEIYGHIQNKRSAPRIPFTALLENSLLVPGQQLFFDKQRDKCAAVLADGSLRLEHGQRGSIHKIGMVIGNTTACNGWDHWYYAAEDGTLDKIDSLRERLRAAGRSNI
jgi:modification methylase